MPNLKPGVIIFLAFVCTQLSAQDLILHRQDVWRDDVTVGQVLKGIKGTLTIRNDSILFSAANRKNKALDFKISYGQITKIKRYRGTLLPNRIGIKTSGNGTYRIFTYKRRAIIGLLEERCVYTAVDGHQELVGSLQ